MHAAGGQQHLADALAGLRLARQRPAERLTVDQPGRQQRLADRLGLPVRRRRVGAPPARSRRGVGGGAAADAEAVVGGLGVNGHGGRGAGGSVGEIAGSAERLVCVRRILRGGF